MTSRLESVFYGKDYALLDLMFEFYAAEAQVILDVACNTRKMWKKSQWASKVIFYDRDPQVNPDRVVAWHKLPHKKQTVDVLVYDPPHLPDAAASAQSLPQYRRNYGLGQGIMADHIGALHAPFLAEAQRVLKPDGLIFAKIKDYIHNHRYQWNLELFNQAVRAQGLTPCDLLIKRDPCGGNLKSSRWKTAKHAKSVHCYWVIVRNSTRCEPKLKPEDPIMAKERNPKKEEKKQATKTLKEKRAEKKAKKDK